MENISRNKKIIFTVTNDLTTDQRMIRICTSLVQAGYTALLIGRKLAQSADLKKEIFQQKRLNCFFTNGKLFYIEYNLRLFFFLLFQPGDAICAIDLDTILPCLSVAKWKGIKLIYDAHEYFPYVPEVMDRPSTQRMWLAIERLAIPKTDARYTVSFSLAKEFEKVYHLPFGLVRNIPFKRPLQQTEKKEKIIVYQGALNKDRGLEEFLATADGTDWKIWLYGDGDIKTTLQALTQKLNIEKQVIFKGKIAPDKLWQETQQCSIGINLAIDKSLSYRLSLSNKLFDYIQAGIPQLMINLPEFKQLNKEKPFGVVIESLSTVDIRQGINSLLNDEKLYLSLVDNCLELRQKFTWENESQQLIKIYDELFR